MEDEPNTVRFWLIVSDPPIVPFPDVWMLAPLIAPVALIFNGAIVCPATSDVTCAAPDTTPFVAAIEPVIPDAPLTNNEPVMVTSPAFDINKLSIVFAEFLIDNPFVLGTKYVFGSVDLINAVLLIVVVAPKNSHVLV